MKASDEEVKVSIIIPTKNEVLSVCDVIQSIYESNIPNSEIILVDGHSTDGTVDKVKISFDHVRIVLQEDEGKGNGMRLGAEQARGNILIFIDADGSHDPSDIIKLYQPIQNNEAEMVVGSRGRGGSDELHGDITKFLRMTGSDFIGLLGNYRFNVRLTDYQNGFRAIKKNIFLKLNLKEKHTTIEQEMGFKALHYGYRIKEIPSHEYARKAGESKISLRRVWFRYIYTAILYLFKK